jgi:hypothetical protein
MSTLLHKIVSKLLLSRLYWHDLRSVNPVSRQFGIDRGTPIDRYYIEEFLRQNQNYIRDNVLEVSESVYSKQFGHNVSSYEVLHVKRARNATIVGDLTKHETLPDNVIDCFICTQVLNFVFDFHKAIEGCHRLLRSGGTILATVGCISPLSRYDADRWGHFWAFYPQGIERAFKSVFGPDNVTIMCYGNSLSAISFVKGLAYQELTKEELDFNDPDYPVSIGIVARKIHP